MQYLPGAVIFISEQALPLTFWYHEKYILLPLMIKAKSILAAYCYGGLPYVNLITIS
jgi:hypothetical protein